MLRFAGLYLLSASALLMAQTVNLNFDALAAKATKKNEIQLDGAALDLARANLKDVSALKDVQGISIHNYEYAKAGDYPASVIEDFLKKVAADTRWKRILSSHEEKESTDIFLLVEGGKPAGFLLISAEEKEVSVIQALGTVELAKLQEVVSSAIQYDMAAVKETAGK